MHIAHVAHSCAQVVARQLCLHGIEYHWFLADAMQGPVNPLCGVAACKRISAKRDFEKGKPLAVGSLSDVGLEARHVESFRFRLDFNSGKHILIVRHKLGGGTTRENHRNDSEQYNMEGFPLFHGAKLRRKWELEKFGKFFFPLKNYKKRLSRATEVLRICFF
jgi:hypothetical protein